MKILTNSMNIPGSRCRNDCGVRGTRGIGKRGGVYTLLEVLMRGIKEKSALSNHSKFELPCRLLGVSNLEISTLIDSLQISLSGQLMVQMMIVFVLVFVFVVVSLLACGC